MRASSRANHRDRKPPRHRSRRGVSGTGRHASRRGSGGPSRLDLKVPLMAAVLAVSLVAASVGLLGVGRSGTTGGELRLAKKDVSWSAGGTRHRAARTDTTFCDRHPHARRCRPQSSPSPTDTASPAGSTTSPSPTDTSSPSPTATVSTSPTSTGTTTGPSPTTAPDSTCTNPQFVTSDPDAGWSDGGYYVHNNMWNASGYDVSQTLAACSYHDWYVTATADDAAGDGAVKTYPNVHKDYHDWGSGAEPRLSSFGSIKSTFAASSPHVGIYDVAYDIWLNGVPGDNEVMIWTDNYRQVPSGSVVAKGVSFSGATWDVYATSGNGYIAFVPSQPMTHGTLDLKAMLDWLVSHGRISSTSTLGQICFGAEIVSTGGQPATFSVSDFSVTTS